MTALLAVACAFQPPGSWRSSRAMVRSASPAARFFRDRFADEAQSLKAEKLLPPN